MRLFIDEEKTVALSEQVAELNEILKKIGSDAKIEKLAYGTVLIISKPLKNPKNAGRKEADSAVMKISMVRELIKELGAEGAAKELGMTKQSMYRRIKRNELAGREYF